MSENTFANYSKSVRVAGIQCAFQNNTSKHLERVLKLTGQALEKNADLVVFPECFALPWFHNFSPDEYKSFAEPIPGPSTEPFLNISMDNKTVFVCPIYYFDNHKYYFATVTICNGNVLEVYQKIHLANAENWRETGLAESGQKLVYVDSQYAKLSIAMGWDAFFPEAFCAMGQNKVQIVIVPTAAAMASKSRWLSLLTSHAVCNNLFVVRINRCGTENNLSFYGNSFCVDPFGNLLDEPTFHRDSLMICDFNMDDIEQAKKEFPVLKKRRPDIYDINNNPQ